MTSTQAKRSRKSISADPPQGVQLIYPGGRKINLSTVADGVTPAGRPRWRVVPPFDLQVIPNGCRVNVRSLPGGAVLVYPSE